MFNQIKNQVTIIQAYEKYCPDVPLKPRGENDYIPEDDLCPWHGGSGCFHIVFDESAPSQGFAKCFSSACRYEEPADVIEFVRRTLDLESPKDAAIRIAHDFNLRIEFETSIHQRIFSAASEYYQGLMLTTLKYPSLGSRTPLEYQKEVRGHSEETLMRARVGWTDGGVTKHLIENCKFTLDQVIATGLAARVNGGYRDKLPAESFIYTAFVGNKASRFTFKTLRTGKDGKPLHWQMKKDTWLNNVLFYGEDTLTSAEDQYNVAVVEGENDMLSLLDLGWEGAIVCTNGQPSKEQYGALEALGQDLNVHTFFDADEAGDKYRQVLWTKEIENLHQYKVPEDDNDIDKYIQRRRADEVNPIERILADGEEQRPAVEDLGNVTVKVTGSGQIVEKDGCYFAVRHTTSPTGDTLVQETMLSNFTLKLNRVFTHRGDRSREMELIRRDGVSSGPVYLNSQSRSSLRLFKEFCSRAVDAIWLGSEADLNNLWLYISMTQKELQVNVPEYCGYVQELNMWIFRNVMINASTGAVYYPDESGIFWTSGTQGIMPQSIVSDILTDGINSRDAYQIPALKYDLESDEEFFEWQGEIIRRLAELVGPHEACTMMAWAQCSAYSSFIFNSEGFSPMFLMWGRLGKGKTTFLRWILSMYDMNISNKGYMQVSALSRSPVGFLRKAEYYSSLPLAMDELRADEYCQSHYSMWRGFYDRSPRVLGTARQGVVRQQPIRATLAFAGQDAFLDSAMQSRCVALKTSSVRQDAISQQAYQWLDEATDDFPRFGFYWIKEAATIDKQQMREAWKEMGRLIDAEMKGKNIGNRTRDIWKIVGSFALRFMESYFPGEDYMPWMKAQILQDADMQTEIDIVSEVWDKIASSQVGVRPTIDSDQVNTDNRYLYLWWPGLKDELTRTLQHLGHAPTTLRTALKEEPYFAGETTKGMGLGNHARRVMRFDLTHERCPDIVKQIAKVVAHQI